MVPSTPKTSHGMSLNYGLSLISLILRQYHWHGTSIKCWSRARKNERQVHMVFCKNGNIVIMPYVTSLNSSSIDYLPFPFPLSDTIYPPSQSHLLLIAHCPPPTTHHLLLAAHHLPPTTCCSTFHFPSQCHGKFLSIHHQPNKENISIPCAIHQMF